MVSFLHLGGFSVVSDQGSANNEVLFLHLVSMFQVAAMQQLGKLMDPVSNEIKRDLVQAKASIDVLDMLKEKTQGNLSEPEREFLDKVLFELHMNYVDEVKAAEQKAEEPAASDAPAEGETQQDETAADETEPPGSEPA